MNGKILVINMIWFKGKDDLGQLFSDITNIEIPLPSVSFLSIFGPQK